MKTSNFILVIVSLLLMHFSCFGEEVPSNSHVSRNLPETTLLSHQSLANRSISSTSTAHTAVVPSASSLMSRSPPDPDEDEEEGEDTEGDEEEGEDLEGISEATSGPSSGTEEEKVPDVPSSLRAKATASNIQVSWTPPKNRRTIVRGYTIGWGVGVPDVYSKVLEPRIRTFTITNLKPQVEYVISLRAYNNMGDGQPSYDTVRTLAADSAADIFPPVGLKAMSLSGSSVILQWTDSSTAKTTSDNRHYVIRYTSNFRSASPKYKYANSTRPTLLIDGLKPATQYEFSVKVVRGKTESTWSMAAINSTLDASPSSPPRDLTIVADEENASAVRLQWQPPKSPNGQITGYMILYTTDESLPDREWSIHPLIGDKMNTLITNMSPDTLYFFKIQAKNEKGSGPVSPAVSFRTLALPSTPNLLRKGNGSSVTSSSMDSLYVTGISVASLIILVLILVVIVILCRTRHGYDRKSGKYAAAATSPRSASNNRNNKRASRELNPPDLWIHHDQLELKSLEKNQDPDLNPTPVLRTFQDPLLTCNSVSPAPPPSLNSSLAMGGGMTSIYDDVGRGSSPSSSLDHHRNNSQHHSNQLSIFPPVSNANTSTIRRTGRAKPIMIPAESVGILTTASSGNAIYDSGQPRTSMYPYRTSYNIHGTLSKGNGASHQLNCFEVNDCNLYDPLTGLSSSSGVGMTMSLMQTSSFPTPAPTLSSSNVSYSSPTHSGNSASGGGGSINSPTMSDQPPPPPSLNHTQHHHHFNPHQSFTTSSPSMNNLGPSGTLRQSIRSYDNSSSYTPSSTSSASPSSTTCANNTLHQQHNNVTPKHIGEYFCHPGVLFL